VGAVQEARREGRDASGWYAILFDVSLPQQAEPGWFEPQRWGAQAQPVAAGGRGSAWFVDAPFGAAVLRHYRRGGLVARLIDDRYLWAGEDSSRCFREFRLLAELDRLGLPVARPIAARLQRSGLFYRADLLVERIAGVRTLAQWLQGELAALPWEAIGALLARFHAAGACHADLNAHNLLLGESGALWLIDFDRGELREPAKGWATGNIARLSRSLRKLCPPGQEAALELGLARLVGAWREGFALA
jgi:3-deoxy-D-manno-octulosonic acid kinase